MTAKEFFDLIRSMPEKLTFEDADRASAAFREIAEDRAIYDEVHRNEVWKEFLVKHYWYLRLSPAQRHGLGVERPYRLEVIPVDEKLKSGR